MTTFNTQTMKQKNESNKVLGHIKLSMSDYIKDIAKARASVCFSGNISAYVAHLILQDFERNQTINNVSDNGVVINGDCNNVRTKNKTRKTP
jgi:hypothetical protein